MDSEIIKSKYPFLTDLDLENLLLIYKYKMDYKYLKKLKKSDLILYTKKYVNEIIKLNKNNNKKSSENQDDDLEYIEYEHTEYIELDLIEKQYISEMACYIDTLFNYKRLKINDKKVNKILKKAKFKDVDNYPDGNLLIKRIKKNKILNLFLMIFFGVIFVLSLISFIMHIKDNNKIDKIDTDIKSKIRVEEVKVNEEDVEIISDDYFKYLNVSMLDVDIEALKKENKDTKGWLKVEGTNINYPFVQKDNNDYYLKHSFDGSNNKKGWVFLDYRNDIDNLDDNTIIYAHGLVNNAMFGSLRKTTKQSWYKNKNNRLVKITTSNKKMLWEVFSTYIIEPESYYLKDQLSNSEERLEFFNTLKQRSVYDYGVSLNENDKILTLSSCYDNTNRMVLHAKLISIK